MCIEIEKKENDCGCTFGCVVAAHNCNTQLGLGEFQSDLLVNPNQ